MKTKNTFRMLLVAVSLLLGANNVNADETIWPLADDNSSANPIDIPASRFVNKISEGSIIKVYCTEGNGYWAITFTSNWNNPSFDEWQGYDYGAVISSNDHKSLVASGSLSLKCSSTTVGLLTQHGLQISINQNITVTEVAIVTGGPVKHKLKYYVDEVLYTTQSYEANEDITLPDPPTKTGYTFVDWDGLPEDMKMPDENLDVNAVFSINHHDVSFMVGETVFSKLENVEYGSTIALPSTRPTQEGKVFTGWTGLPATMPDEDVVVTASFRNGIEHEAWHGEKALDWNWGDQEKAVVVDASHFRGTTGNVYLRVYGVPTGDWQIQVGYVDESNQGKKITIDGNNEGTISIYSADSKKSTMAYGYVEYKLDSEVLGIFNTYGARVGGAAFTASQVTVIADSFEEQSEKADVTLAFSVTEAEATIGEDFTEPILTATSGEQVVEGLAIKYTSSDAAVATVDEATGEVTPLTAGTTTITAAFEGDQDYNAATSVSYTLTVSAPSQEEKQASSITFGDDVVITFGQEFTAPTVTTTPENAALTYSSLNINVASIINNTVVPVGAGDAVITATFAGDDDYNGTSATYNITVNAPVTEGALWSGAGYLGDWAAPERGNVGINVGIPDGTFESVELGDTLRFHAKLGPLDANNWAIQMANGDWNGNIFDMRAGNDGFASGYYDVVVNTDEFLTKLKSNGTWGSCAYVQGYNLTLTAITLRKNGTSPQPEQTINGNWTATSDVPDAGATLKDDDAVTINTVYNTTVDNDSRSIHGKQFNQYITVRVDQEPSADNVTGTQKDTNTPVTIEAKRDVTVVFYYRRQKDGGDTDWSYTNNDGKDLKLVDQADPTTIKNGTLSVNNANADYAYACKTYTLEAGHTYTVWAKGTTVRLYGIYYSTEASNVQVNQTYKLTYIKDESIYTACWYAAGATINALEDNPTKEGYTFNGWKDAAGNDIPSTMPANNITVYAQFTQNVTPQPVDEYITVNMGNYAYRTYVTTANVDFSQSIGIKGYYATGLNSDGTAVEFIETTGIVPSGTPLLLQKVDGASEYKLYKSDTEGTAPSPNKLVAGTGSNIGGTYKYVLTVHSGSLVFAETNYQAAYVDSAHAYLDLNGSNARGRLSISFGNGEGTTGIENFNVDKSDDMQIYDLKGLRIDKPTKGLYIINGKKVLIK